MFDRLAAGPEPTSRRVVSWGDWSRGPVGVRWTSTPSLLNSQDISDHCFGGPRPRGRTRHPERIGLHWVSGRREKSSHARPRPVRRQRKGRDRPRQAGAAQGRDRPDQPRHGDHEAPRAPGWRFSHSMSSSAFRPKGNVAVPARGPASRFWRSTVALWSRRCWRANCSGMSGERSQAQPTPDGESSNWPTAVRFSSMTLGTPARVSRPSCSGSPWGTAVLLRTMPCDTDYARVWLQQEWHTVAQGLMCICG